MPTVPEQENNQAGTRWGGASGGSEGRPLCTAQRVLRWGPGSATRQTLHSWVSVTTNHTTGRLGLGSLRALPARHCP